MSDKTFHVTGEDVRKMESQESKFHGGDIPKDSDTSAMKVRIPLSSPLRHTTNNSSSKSSQKIPNQKPIKSNVSKPTFPSLTSP